MSSQFVESNNLTEIGCPSADQQFKTTAIKGPNLCQNTLSRSPDGKKLTVFGHGRVVELRQQSLSQRAVTAEVGRGKRVLLILQKQCVIYLMIHF